MRSCLAAGALALFCAADVQAFTYEGRFEINATGDFDGDGQTDVLLVERETGSFRIGYQTAPGAYLWSDPRPSGVEAADAIAVGKLVQTTRDGFAIGSTLANRVNVIEAPFAAGAAVPRAVFPPGIGPNAAIAINIPGAGDTAHDDLMIGSDGNGGGTPGRLALMRNNAGTATFLFGGNYETIGSGNRFLLKTTGPTFAGALARLGATDELRVYSPQIASYNQVLSVAGLQRGSRFLTGHFTAGLFNHVLFYRPAQQTFFSHPSSEPVAGTFAIGAGISFDLGAPIAQLVSLPNATTDRLLAIFENGSARVYNFNGSTAPTEVSGFSPDAGEHFTSVVPTAAGEFLLLSGAGNTSTAIRKYTPAGASGYTAGPKITLPVGNSVTANANVFLFREEPFVSSAPGLLKSVGAGDWTSDFGIVAGAPPTFRVDVWNFLGGSAGLDNPITMNLGNVAPTTSFGLVNQYASNISLFSRSPAIGDEIVEVNINPEPGEFKKAIKVSLSSTLPGAQLFYRLSASAAWTLYSAPFDLFRTTTVQYYGKPIAGDTKSRIHVAAYTFPTDPSVQDSDRDGIPDFAELGRNLNPNGGKDQDGDGFTDFNELVAGTNPLDGSLMPTDAQRLEEKAAFDLSLGLVPMNGPANANSQAALGTGVRSFDLHGSILRAGAAANNLVIGITDPSLKEIGVVLDTDPPLIAVATDPHYDIVTAGADKRLGREMVGILPVPRPPLPEVTYELGGGTLASEANSWVAAAQALYGALPRETVKANLDINATLSALLFERKVAQILTQRGNPAGANMTFFPFRPSDSARTNPPPALLRSLEFRVNDMQPGYKLSNVKAMFDDMVKNNAPAGMIALKTVISEIYRVSSALNNAAPATYAFPVDVIRRLFETGVLDANYAAVVAPIDLTAALNAYNTALSIIESRPTVTKELIVRADTFQGDCSVLDSTALPAAQHSLIHPGGPQYRLLESFNLIPGSRIHVFGYTDVANAECPGTTAIEVISLALESVPQPTSVDGDGDLLLDALELLLFGGLGSNGSGDNDGDGYSNLQELLDGTDPMDAGGHGTTIVDLSAPDIDLELEPGGELTIVFNWPASYLHFFQFSIASTSDLGLGFANPPEPVTPLSLGGNTFQITLANPGTSVKFYQLSLAIN